MPDTVLPRIAVLTTGGTIAGAPAPGLSYKAGSLSAEHLLESVPHLARHAQLSVENIANVGSQDIDYGIWKALAERVRALVLDEHFDGVVITHGTDTLEETAFFLHLAVSASKPVVLTGAMRPAHALGADGPANLRDAVVAAASPAARSLGICVLMNQTLYDAVEVQKVAAEGLDAFSCRNHGPLARLQQECLHVYAGRHLGNPVWRAAFAHNSLESWPTIHVLYTHVGMKPALLDAMLATRPEGIVVAGVGNGNAPAWVWGKLHAEARHGLIVLRTSRTSAGYVGSGIEVDDENQGFFAAGSLSAQKAHILLLLALQSGAQTKQLKNLLQGI